MVRIKKDGCQKNKSKNEKTNPLIFKSPQSWSVSVNVHLIKKVTAF